MDLIYLDDKALKLTKERYQNNHADTCKDMEKFLALADKILNIPPYSVTHKKVAPPGGTLHDYASIGTYWWPNPDTEDGLPYIKRDGYTNPQVDDLDYYDRRRLDAFFSSVHTLSLAYYYSDDAKYRDYAIKLIKVWFINEETKMNPSLTYAQCIPGKCTGRDIGIIDGYAFADFIDDLNIIKYEDDGSLKKWLSDYSNWLLTDKNGISEGKKLNNHGMWFDVQLMSILHYIEKDELIIKQIETFTKSRLDSQISADGSMPEELARTKSYDYTLFNTRAVIGVCSLAEKVHIDLWNYNNGTVKNVFEFFIPYLKGDKVWNWQQVQPFNPLGFIPIFQKAFNVYGDDKFAQMASYIKEKHKHTDNIGYLAKYPKR